MANEKFSLTFNPEIARSCYVLRRRRRELARRINNGIGSEQSISFDREEHQAISRLLNFVREHSEKHDAVREDEKDESILPVSRQNSVGAV